LSDACLYHHQLKTNEDTIKARIERNLNDGKRLDEINFKSRASAYHRPKNNTSRKHKQRRNFSVEQRKG